MAKLRAVRNSRRALTEAEAREILTRADHGVLATVDADGQPYAVPLNHVLVGDALYAHCTLEGHKLRNIAHEPRVSYCAIESAEVDPAILSTYYASTIVFGRAELVKDEAEKRVALVRLVERMGAVMDAKNEAYFARMLEKTAVICIGIEEISGKVHRRG
ncbi:MAG: pyridoxamine 5'-phosphate oxidase family protein [Terracidiphilus sp.]|nr:pyridoxamine 5'-phosphate oxidase family protein [Terracidiphilus sp.]